MTTLAVAVVEENHLKDKEMRRAFWDGYEQGVEDEREQDSSSGSGSDNPGSIDSASDDDDYDNRNERRTMMIMNKVTVMGTMMGRMTPTTIPIIRMITTTNQLHQTQRRDPLHARSQPQQRILRQLRKTLERGVSSVK